MAVREIEPEDGLGQPVSKEPQVGSGNDAVGNEAARIGKKPSLFYLFRPTRRAEPRIA
jgi:hypothetical protein